MTRTNTVALLVTTLALSTLYAQEAPLGTAGDKGLNRDRGLRQMSRHVAANALTWTGCGIANIDGIISPGEWTGAMSQVISVNTSAGTVNGTLYVMNDNHNLYVGLKFPETAANYGSLAVEFDNDDNGVPFEEGDDAVVENNQLGFF